MEKNSKKGIREEDNKHDEGPEKRDNNQILSEAVEEIKEKVVDEFLKDNPHETYSNLTLYFMRKKLEKDLTLAKVNFEDIEQILFHIIDDCYKDCIEKIHHALGRFGASALIQEFHEQNVEMIDHIANQRLTELLSKENKETDSSEEKGEMPDQKTIAKIRAALISASNEAETIMFA